MKETHPTSETEVSADHNQPVDELYDNTMATIKELDVKQEALSPTSSTFIAGLFEASDTQPPRSPLSPQLQALLTPKQRAIRAFQNHWASIESQARQKIEEALKGVENGLPDSYKTYHEAQKENEELGNRCKSEQETLQASLGICFDEFKAKGEELKNSIFLKDENADSAPGPSDIIFCKCKQTSCKTNNCPCRKAGQLCGIHCRLGKRHQCANQPSQPIQTIPKENIAAEVEATRKRLREELSLAMGPNKKVRAWMIEDA